MSCFLYVQRALSGQRECLSSNARPCDATRAAADSAVIHACADMLLCWSLSGRCKHALDNANGSLPLDEKL